MNCMSIKMKMNYACLLLCLGFFVRVESKRCNEVLCASAVSKCMLTQACKCDLSRNREKCTCCVGCAKCLGKYYQECCSCLDMCDDEELELDPNDSQVGDFSDPFEELFEALTKDKDVLDGIIVTYPALRTIDDINKKLQKNKYKKDPSTRDSLAGLEVNCTVAFMSQCHSANKCRDQCKRIGSGSYRFFFNGCCECVGPTCLNYGINESRCPLCSSTDNYYYDQHFLGDDPSVNNNLVDDKLGQQ